MRRIVDEAREKVDEILTRERSALDALAVRLLEKEVIEADELREILAERSPEVLGPGAGVKSGD